MTHNEQVDWIRTQLATRPALREQLRAEGKRLFPTELLGLFQAILDRPVGQKLPGVSRPTTPDQVQAVIDWTVARVREHLGIASVISGALSDAWDMVSPSSVGGAIGGAVADASGGAGDALAAQAKALRDQLQAVADAPRQTLDAIAQGVRDGATQVATRGATVAAVGVGAVVVGGAAWLGYRAITDTPKRRSRR